MDFMRGLLAVCLSATGAFCCVAPTNIEGVAFTSDEEIQLNILEALGIPNVNYFKDSTDDARAIRYTSHYCADAMVFIGNYGLSYQKDIKMNCMGIILDNQKMPENGYINKEQFDFAEAVKTELQWLKQKEVISISHTLIDSIFSSLGKSVNGSIQYWTLQKNTLTYNSWYSKDSLNSTWSANSVRSVDGVKGCSGIQPEFSLPPQNLQTTGSKSFQFKAVKSLNMRWIDHKTLRISLPEKLIPYKDLILVSASGKVASKLTNQQTKQIVDISIPATRNSGLYYLIMQNGKEYISIPIMFLR